ncbi:hypothetical protein V8C86DRAFT_258156 [Haematococcus lacustris]
MFRPRSAAPAFLPQAPPTFPAASNAPGILAGANTGWGTTAAAVHAPDASAGLGAFAAELGSKAWGAAAVGGEAAAAAGGGRRSLVAAPGYRAHAIQQARDSGRGPGAWVPELHRQPGPPVAAHAPSEWPYHVEGQRAPMEWQQRPADRRAPQQGSEPQQPSAPDPSGQSALHLATSVPQMLTGSEPGPGASVDAGLRDQWHANLDDEDWVLPGTPEDAYG